MASLISSAVIIMWRIWKVRNDRICKNYKGTSLWLCWRTVNPRRCYFMLSKLELCNICYFEDYVKVFRKYYFLVNPPKNEYWLEQFFIKLPSPWDEMSRKVTRNF
jgi:hypothetical protein